MKRFFLSLLRYTLPALLLIVGWPITAHADPISISLSTVLISLAISAATTAGSMLLTRILTPKPKSNELGKMQGQIQIADSTWDVVKPEIYGGPLDDGIGGSMIGINVIWMNKEGLRERRTTVPSSSGGGGKGPPKPPPDVKITYDCDIACLVGAGPLEILRVKFNDDVAYSVVTAGPGNENRQYEAENAVTNTFSGTAAIVNDALCSNGKKVNLPLNQWVQFGSVKAESNTDFDLTIYYLNAADSSLQVLVNGAGAQTVALPNSAGAVGVVTVPIVLVIGTTNTIRLTNLSAATMAIDRIFPLVVPIFDPPDDPGGGDDPYRRHRLAGVTGIVDDLFPAEMPYDPFLPPDPRLTDPNPILRHSAIAPAAAADGSITATLNNGFYAEIKIYEGNDDQEPDEVISADIDSQFPTELAAGRTSTPAYLGDCYFRISQLNISKYNGFPNITVTARHKTLNIVEDILVFRAKKVGLLDADLDLSATNTTPCRGYVITQQESPKDTMEAFAQRFNFDFVETPDGVIEAVDLTDRTIVDTIDESELGAVVKGESESSMDLVTTSVPDESDMWKYAKVGFFNPLMEWQTDSRQDVYPFTTSEQTQSVSWNMTLLPDEAFEVARRMLQMHWAAATPDAFVLPDSRVWLYPSNRILLPINGQLRARRISEMQGTFPGVFKCTAVPDELAIFAGGALVPGRRLRPVTVPANSIASFLDIPLLNPQLAPGLYLAACARDPNSGDWTGATAFRFKGGDWQQMCTFVAPATIGRTTNAMADVPGTWTTVRQTFVRHFYYGSNAGGGGGDGALDRQPSYSELGTWTDKLRRDDPLVVTRAMGREIFLGLEYETRARTDVQFVTDLYSAYLDRDPNDPPDSDMTGRDAWVAYLATHTRLELIEQFEVLPEFLTHIDTATGTFFDTVASVTVDFFNGEPSSITDQQAREGNSLWIIGDEAVVVAQWTRDGSQPNRWTGTRMFRRLRGTDDDSDIHESGERVVLVNSALRFVGMDESDKDVEQSWKIVTAGARIEDAAELRITWHGLNIRPAQVINLKGTRVSSDLVITLDPGVDGAFLPERYVIRIRDASTGELKRTVILTVENGVPAVWTYYIGGGNQALINKNPDGSIYTTVQPTGVVVYTSQPFYGDGIITWDVTDRPFALLGIVSSPPGIPTGTFVESATWFGQPQFIDAEVATGLIRRLPPGAKLEMRILNGQVEYYINDLFWMRSYQGPVPSPWCIVADFSEAIVGPQGMLRVRVLPAVPRQFVYTVEMQRTDFGPTPPATVTVDATQISAEGVEGPGARITA